MIDVNKITSTLAKLPDQQLQQYAQMHKNDPYIMALAMSESNRRKELRAAGQGAAQEQPKVVDQMVAQMAPQQLPEDQGIGQLPAGEMNFAGGGIVAFADGGDVERYSGEFGSFVDGIDPLTGTFYMPDAPPDAASMRRVRASPYVTPQITAEEAALLQRFPKLAAAAPKVDAAPKADTRLKAPRTASVGTAAAPTEDKGSSGLDALIKDYTRSTELAQGALGNRRVGLAAQLEQEALGAKEEGEKRRKERGDVFASREARLAEREDALTGMKDKHLGLALLQAGAAMMSTPGNLGSVIGKGIAVGSERYIAGIDKINAAKDKFAEARDRLDDLRLHRDDMNEKEIREENRAIRNARIQGQQLLLDGATNDLKISNDNQKAIFGVAAENIQTDKRIASAEKIARLQASSGNRNNQLEMLQALQADPKLMATYRTMQGKNEDVMGQYNDFLKANPALALDPKAAFTQFLMTKSAFAQLGAPTVTDKAAGPVRKQP